MAAAVPKAAAKNAGSARRRHSPSKRSRNPRRAIRGNGYRSQTRLSRNLRPPRRLHNRSIPPRQPVHATRRKCRKSRTRFFSAAAMVAPMPQRPPEASRAEYGTIILRGSPSPQKGRRRRLSSSRKRVGENHIRAARKPAGSQEETVQKSKPPANMKKLRAGTGQAAQTAMANDAGNLLIAQNLSAGARRIALFSAPFRVQAPKNLFDKLARTNLI